MTDTVTISLSRYEEMNNKILRLENQLQHTKQQLKNEKNLTWKMFGPIFSQPKSLIEREDKFGKVVELRYNVPYIRIGISSGYSTEMDKNLIIRTLLERHIGDMLQQVEYHAQKTG